MQNTGTVKIHNTKIVINSVKMRESKT